MLGLLGVLIRIFLIVRVRNTDDALEEWLIALPFTMYLAWICVATIANVSAVLFHFGLQPGQLMQEIWTIAMASIATLLGVLFVSRYRAWSFSLVVLWALIGICLRWANGEHPLIFYFSIVLITGLTIFIIYKALRPVET
jgi:hypothetical protein